MLSPKLRCVPEDTLALPALSAKSIWAKLHSNISVVSVQAEILDIEDLEADATPEDLMLSYVSGEKGKVCAVQTHHVLSNQASYVLACSFPSKAAVLITQLECRTVLTVSMSHLGSSSCGRPTVQCWTSSGTMLVLRHCMP